MDVAERVGSGAEFVAGLHGLEITGPDCAFHHYALDAVAPAIARLTTEAVRALAWCPSLFLENKTYALTCHVRLVPPALGDRALEEFEALAEPQLEARVLKLLPGAKALELLPAVDWHKGRAAEDAFDALGDTDVVIGVGDRPHTHLIDWRLAGPASVGRFFHALAEHRGH